MSEGLKLISACIREQQPGIILGLDETVLNEGAELDVFHFVKRHYRENRALPQPLTILEHTAHRLTQQAPEEPRYYENNLYARRAMMVAKVHYASLREHLQQTTPDAQDRALDEALQLVQALRTRRNAPEIQTMREVYEQFDRGITQRRREPDAAGVLTPWPSFNRLTGGHQPGDVNFVVARPGIGKTMVLLAQALHAVEHENKRVLFVTTEMSAQRIVMRSIAMRFGLRGDYARTGTMATNSQLWLRQRFSEYEAADDFFLMPAGFKTNTLSIAAAIEEIRPDVVFIDGVYLLKPSSKGHKQRHERVADVIEELKQVAIDEHLPIVCSTQFNRQAGKGGRDGALENVGSSDIISQIGSIVIALRESSMYDGATSRELEFIKGREGETGTVHINYVFHPVVDLSEIVDANAPVAAVVGDADEHDEHPDEDDPHGR